MLALVYPKVESAAVASIIVSDIPEEANVAPPFLPKPILSLNSSTILWALFSPIPLILFSNPTFPLTIADDKASGSRAEKH